MTATDIAAAPTLVRERSARRVRRRRWSIVCVVVVLVVSAAAVALSTTSIVDVREVRVVGLDLVPQDAVLAAADVRLGTPLLRVDAAAVAQRVETLAGVRSVDVRYGWPHTLVLAVTERVPVGARRSGTGVDLVDADGMIVVLASRDARGLPLVSGAANPYALTALAELPGDFRRDVRSATASTPDGIVLTLVDGTAVNWGDPSQTQLKVDVTRALRVNRPATIDVSSPRYPATTSTLPPPAR